MDWRAGWLRKMRSCFEEDELREYCEGDLELEKWFDSGLSGFYQQ